MALRYWPGCRTWGRRALAIPLLFALGAGGWAGGIQLTGNVHAVKPNEIYRSAQINGPNLAGVLDKYGIKTVINLRGEHVGSKWYDDELAVTAKHGVAHIDIRMSAKREPDAVTLQRLMEALRTARRPLLVHCNSGSDRTGLA